MNSETGKATKINEAIDIVTQALRDILEREQQPSEWISVKDRLPEETIDVIGLTDTRDVYKCHYNKRGYWVRNGFLFVSEVTHWMPLPEPPKEE